MVVRKKYTSAVAVSLPTKLLEKVDRDAKVNFDTRSGRLSEIVRRYYEIEEQELGSEERDNQNGVWGPSTVSSHESLPTTPTSLSFEPNVPPTEVLDPGK